MSSLVHKVIMEKAIANDCRKLFVFLCSQELINALIYMYFTIIGRTWI